jgi:hypothetical protein
MNTKTVTQFNHSHPKSTKSTSVRCFKLILITIDVFSIPKRLFLAFPFCLGDNNKRYFFDPLTVSRPDNDKLIADTLQDGPQQDVGIDVFGLFTQKHTHTHIYAHTKLP